MSEAYPHLVQHNLSTRVGKRPSAASWPPAVISSLAFPCAEAACRGCFRRRRRSPKALAVAALERLRLAPSFGAGLWRGPLARAFGPTTGHPADLRHYPGTQAKDGPEARDEGGTGRGAAIVSRGMQP